MNDETFTFEDRVYENPTVSRDTQLQFIDNLRQAQAAAKQQIGQETQALGNNVASNLGGLTGAEGLLQARYQTPQINAQVAGLKQAAQQTALNTAMTNLQKMYQNRYNQAKTALERAQYSYSTRGTGGNGSTGSSSGSGSENSGINQIPIEQGTTANTTISGEIDATVSGPAGSIAVAGEDYTEYTDTTSGVKVRKYNDGHTEVFRNGVWVKTDKETASSPLFIGASFGADSNIPTSSIMPIPNVIKQFLGAK